MLNSNKAFRLGCDKSFADYKQRYADQQCLRSEGIDKNILAAVFTEFPNLSRVTYTDYRGLARNGDRFFPLLNILTETSKVRLKCLAIGPHAFEYTGEYTSELADPNYPQNPQYLDISGLEDVFLGRDTKLSHMLNELKQLRFAFCYSGHCADEDRMRGQVRELLQASAPRLRSLTLHMIYLFLGGVRDIPKVDNDSRFDVFKSIITPLSIPHLRSLSLRRFIFTAEELKAFLLAHSATLRDLHLVDCLCGDDEIMLARWGGETLALMGIELSGFLSSLDLSSLNLYGWKCVDPMQWQQMRPIVTESEARQLETMWLAGRKNWVKRQQRREISPVAKWWRQPACRQIDMGRWMEEVYGVVQNPSPLLTANID
ncbi:hypothetical protein LTR29_017527 [Friedmanniomyces endolithicus]|nr:hypothetical protein LTR35_017719 [Friedmanniomyces endolithicus]KAK0268081.1 hypothetical protein LTS00_017655 [Friedmanniomyces endolithicus]KAK0302717.1 hypothetical protein LTR01_008557 [Friedmanniomyces endolithicus]KAK0822754.1 hypothetical protein LTR73_009064 [Friedmanniomyces endolithicus]KAK0927955.1 hypothetical protein LTR29_017527 [Friedmanniomyces endolithicus]